MRSLHGWYDLHLAAQQLVVTLGTAYDGHKANVQESLPTADAYIAMDGQRVCNLLRTAGDGAKALGLLLREGSPLGIAHSHSVVKQPVVRLQRHDLMIGRHDAVNTQLLPIELGEVLRRSEERKEKEQKEIS